MQPREVLFLSLMVTNCSGERSFSRFKITKNELKQWCWNRGPLSNFHWKENLTL